MDGKVIEEYVREALRHARGGAISLAFWKLSKWASKNGLPVDDKLRVKFPKLVRTKFGPALIGERRGKGGAWTFLLSVPKLRAMGLEG